MYIYIHTNIYKYIKKIKLCLQKVKIVKILSKNILLT